MIAYTQGYTKRIWNVSWPGANFAVLYVYAFNVAGELNLPKSPVIISVTTSVALPADTELITAGTMKEFRGAGGVGDLSDTVTKVERSYTTYLSASKPGRGGIIAAQDMDAYLVFNLNHIHNIFSFAVNLSTPGDPSTFGGAQTTLAVFKGVKSFSRTVDPGSGFGGALNVRTTVDNILTYYDNGLSPDARGLSFVAFNSGETDASGHANGTIDPVAFDVPSYTKL